MKIFVNGDAALFRTPFTEGYDLVQKFRGINNDNILFNTPIDHTEVGLIKTDATDVWHSDVIINTATDEAAPCHVNNSFIGANHGHHGAVKVYSKNHGLTYSDIGKIYQDQAGLKFTLLRVFDDENLLFISENVGASVNDYKFITTITGLLTEVNDEKVITVTEQGSADLRKANRYKKKQIIAFTHGEPRKVVFSATCDYAEIQEDYDIINPATVAYDIRLKRPKDGYTQNPDLSKFGEPMLEIKLIYRIQADGSLLTIFDAKKVMEVNWDIYMGIMYQEKRNVYGGGIIRRIPKLKPFTTPEGTFDFEKGVPVKKENFPYHIEVGKEHAESPLALPDRFVDYFRDNYKNDNLCFACGFLPVDDGIPSERIKELVKLFLIRYTLKAYPFFKSGNVTSAKGVGYKKFFIPDKNRSGVYTINHDGKTYAYFDFMDKETLTLNVNGKVSLFEKSNDVNYKLENGTLTVLGENGYATFIIE